MDKNEGKTSTETEHIDLGLYTDRTKEVQMPH